MCPNMASVKVVSGSTCSGESAEVNVSDNENEVAHDKQN